MHYCSCYSRFFQFLISKNDLRICLEFPGIERFTRRFLLRRFASLFICEYFSTLDFPSSGRRLGPGRQGQVPTGYKGTWPLESYTS